jgi:hypothetical protein
MSTATNRRIAKQADAATKAKLPLALLQRANVTNQFIEDAQEALGSMSVVDVARECLWIDDEPPPGSPNDVIRAAVSGPGTTFDDVFTTAVTTAVALGYSEQTDNSAGLFIVMPALNFKEQTTLVLDDADTLQWLPRGGTADSARVTVSSGKWQLARFAKNLIVDGMDLVDMADAGVIMLSAEQLGAAARRLGSDQFFAELLSNPALDVDSKALFHADHGNLATAALDGTALATAIAAIGNQTKTTLDGDPIHLNLKPNVLLVPPNLDSAARAAVLAIKLDDPKIDIEVRAESRISATGVVHPGTGELQTGSATGWYLASKSRVNAGFVVGHLSGRPAPTTRRFELGQGEWGLGWSIVANTGIKVIGYESWYYSDGTV